MNNLKNKKQRLTSLDALRGFVMFWIIGGDALVHSLARVTDNKIIGWMSAQLIHVSWNGFHFYDLIFPLFMFISGVTIPFSIGSKLNSGHSKSELIKKTAIRMIILVLFGVIYNNKLSFDFANLRYASVLGQIGIAYFVVAVLVESNLKSLPVFAFCVNKYTLLSKCVI